MEQKVILGVVILISLCAHIWLYRWMKFKMDEGAIIRYLKDAQEIQEIKQDRQIPFEDIALNISMDLERVKTVCAKSKELTYTKGLCRLSEIRQRV